MFWLVRKFTNLEKILIDCRKSFFFFEKKFFFFSNFKKKVLNFEIYIFVFDGLGILRIIITMKYQVPFMVIMFI